MALRRTRAAAAGQREEPARARLDVEARRRQLLELGLELFSDRAYDEVSIDELAEAAGISKGLLYHYFPTKRDFYVATVREAAAQLVATTAPEPRADARARLDASLDAYLDYVTVHGKAYGALLRGGIGTDAEVSEVVDRTRETLCARLVEGLGMDGRRPFVRLALRGWIGFVESATLDWLDAPRGVSRAALRDLLAKMLVAAAQATG